MKNDKYMIKTSFKDFLNEQVLTIEDSMDDFDMQNSKWELEYNVTDLYNKYKKDKNINDFIKKYKDRLVGKKDNLVRISNECWNDLVKIVKEKHKEDVLPYLDKIYDWADKYGVKIISSK